MRREQSIEVVVVVLIVRHLDTVEQDQKKRLWVEDGRNGGAERGVRGTRKRLS